MVNNLIDGTVNSQPTFLSLLSKVAATTVGFVAGAVCATCRAATFSLRRTG
jgi:hypothetical protein